MPRKTRSKMLSVVPKFFLLVLFQKIPPTPPRPKISPPLTQSPSQTVLPHSPLHRPPTKSSSSHKVLLPQSPTPSRTFIPILLHSSIVFHNTFLHHACHVEIREARKRPRKLGVLQAPPQVREERGTGRGTDAPTHRGDRVPVVREIQAIFRRERERTSFRVVHSLLGRFHGRMHAHQTTGGRVGDRRGRPKREGKQNAKDGRIFLQTRTNL